MYSVGITNPGIHLLCDEDYYLYNSLVSRERESIGNMTIPTVLLRLKASHLQCLLSSGYSPSLFRPRTHPFCYISCCTMSLK
jgi:hypothetical protein